MSKRLCSLKIFNCVYHICYQCVARASPPDSEAALTTGRAPQSSGWFGPGQDGRPQARTRGPQAQPELGQRGRVVRAGPAVCLLVPSSEGPRILSLNVTFKSLRRRIRSCRKLDRVLTAVV